MVRFLMCLVVIGSLAGLASAESKSYDDLLASSKQRLKDGDLTGALAEAQKAISLDQSRWEAYALGGAALVQEQRCSEAKENLERAMDRAPQEKRAAIRQLVAKCSSSESVQDGQPRTPPATSSSTSTSTPTQAEILFWKSIENSSRKDDYQAYLSQYPTGTYAALARSRVKSLEDSDAIRNRQTEALKANQEAQDAAGVSFSDIWRYGSWTRIRGTLVVSSGGVSWKENKEMSFQRQCDNFSWYGSKDMCIGFVPNGMKELSLCSNRGGKYMDGVRLELRKYCPTSELH